jgi:hypothetical protein
MNLPSECSLEQVTRCDSSLSPGVCAS